MPLSTKTGDNGVTGLFGGKRISKAHPRLHAYGTIDELNSLLSIVRNDVPETYQQHIDIIQQTLFYVSSDLATISETSSIRRIDASDVKLIEQWTLALEAILPPLQTFILPGGTPLASYIHLARTVARRAERWIVETKDEGSDPVNPCVLQYINRLSDYLFILARAINSDAGIDDVSIIMKRTM